METEKTSKNTRMIVLITTTLASFLWPFMVSAVNIALPKIGDEFHMDAIVMGWVPTSALLASAALLVPFGRLADIYGRRRVFVIGTLNLSLGCILSLLANSIPFFISSRVLQGMGSAMVFATAIAMLTPVYPPGERGRVLGVHAASVYLGLSLGPLLGGLITDHAGWRTIFAIGFALSFPIALVALWKLRSEWAEAKGERFDYVGSIIFAVSLITLIYGLTSLPDIFGVLHLIVGIIGIFIFAAWE